MGNNLAPGLCAYLVFIVAVLVAMSIATSIDAGRLDTGEWASYTCTPLYGQPTIHMVIMTAVRVTGEEGEIFVVHDRGEANTTVLLHSEYLSIQAGNATIIITEPLQRGFPRQLLVHDGESIAVCRLQAGCDPRHSSIIDATPAYAAALVASAVLALHMARRARANPTS